jgi:hypothetical protein
LRTQRAPAVLLRRRAHGPPATASGCAPHGVSIKRPLALTRCSWSCRWWPAAPGWRASSPCAAPPAAPPPRSAAPPPAPVARPDGCLNDAPCPPFTSHGAPMRQPRRLNKAPATARSGVGHMCHHHACAAGRAQARMATSARTGSMGWVEWIVHVTTSATSEIRATTAHTWPSQTPWGEWASGRQTGRHTVHACCASTHAR